MSELSDLLSNKVSGNISSIDTLNEIKPSIQTNINLFSPVCTTIDTQIVSIAASIVTLQNEIISLSVNAFAVGCGTTSGSSTLYPDTVKNYSYNLCAENYDGDAPYDTTSSLLTSGNVGVGTFLLYTQNDSSQSGIGTLYVGIGTCYRPLGGCTAGVCASFASSITSRQDQITTLRSQLTNLISSSNGVKFERLDYEIQRYGNNYAIKILTNENTRIAAAITTINIYSQGA